MAEWKYSLLGCFGNPKLCIVTCLVPGWTQGKIAEHLGDDCLTVGLLATLGIPFGPVLRWRLRKKEGLEGSLIKDGLIYTILPCCAMCQDYRQIYGDQQKVQFDKSDMGPGAIPAQAMARE